MSAWNQQPSRVTVLDALDPDDAHREQLLAPLLRLVDNEAVFACGPMPGKQIDALLDGRIAVVGTDADLGAVVKRLVRTEQLEHVEVAFVPSGDSIFARRHTLPRGERAARLAVFGEVDPVPILRDDRGGVLVGIASIAPVNGTVYVDEHRVLAGTAKALAVQPDNAHGLVVNVMFRKFGVIGKRSTTQAGRAVEIGLRFPGQVIADGHERAADVDKWTYYTHTARLRLVRGIVD